jgi:hypothetical protein
MVRQIIESGCPIQFDPNQLAEHGILYPAGNAQSSENARGLAHAAEAFDRESIKGKIHDALVSLKA